MSILFLESFEWLPTGLNSTALNNRILEKYSTSNFSFNSSIFDFNGSHTLELNPNTGMTTKALIEPNLARDTLTVGMQVRTSTNFNTNINTTFMLIVASGSTTLANVRVNSSGDILLYRGNTLVLNTGVRLSLSTNYYIELQFRLGSVGRFELRLNNQQVFVDDSVNLDPGSAGWDRVRWQGIGNNHFIDNIYVTDDQGGSNIGFLGPIAVEYLVPNGDGDSNQWTPSEGTENYLMVDDAVLDADTTFVSSSTSGELDLYQITDIPAASTPIIGFQVVHTLRADSGPVNVSSVVRSGGTDVTESIGEVSNGSYFCYLSHFSSSPNSGQFWTDAEINSIQVGIQID